MTAENFCKEYNIKAGDMQSLLSYVMKEFAKYHVKKAIFELTKVENDRVTSIKDLEMLTERNINEFYPLTNIT